MGHSDVEKPLYEGADRRVAIRVVYETVAMVAEYDGENFPLFSSFWEVQTIDLSASGISFWSPKSPTTPKLLLMLGNPQANPILVEARVANCTLQPGSTTTYRVGCELLKRLTN